MIVVREARHMFLVHFGRHEKYFEEKDFEELRTQQ